MEVGQIGLGTQPVQLNVVEVHNCIQKAVQILHQMKLERLVLESRPMWKCAMKKSVVVSSMENMQYNFKLR
jgi:hypothetical protein